MYGLENKMGFHGRYAHPISGVLMVIQFFCNFASNVGNKDIISKWDKEEDFNIITYFCLVCDTTKHNLCLLLS